MRAPPTLGAGLRREVGGRGGGTIGDPDQAVELGDVGNAGRKDEIAVRQLAAPLVGRGPEIVHQIYRLGGGEVENLRDDALATALDDDGLEDDGVREDSGDAGRLLQPAGSLLAPRADLEDAVGEAIEGADGIRILLSDRGNRGLKRPEGLLLGLCAPEILGALDLGDGVYDAGYGGGGDDEVFASVPIRRTMHLPASGSERKIRRLVSGLISI